LKGYAVTRQPAREKISPRSRTLRVMARRVLVWAVIAAVLTGLVAADRAGLFGQAPPDDYAAYHRRAFRVIRVVDGDTLDIAAADTLNGTSRTRIRLWGVDTPETVKPDEPVQHFGPEASAHTTARCLGQQVRIELIRHHTRDKYDRLLAYVYLPDGSLLNRELLELGLAYADPRYAHPMRTEFVSLMKETAREGKGLWAKLSADDLPYYLADARLTWPARR
jgi:micrococcal nuclease